MSWQGRSTWPGRAKHALLTKLLRLNLLGMC